MRFEIEFARTYPHPIGKVWRALTDSDALGVWLMESNFVPEIGHSFQMWCADGEGGTDRYLCTVRELQQPHRMVWSWVRDGRQGEGETLIEFCLEELSLGTRLTMRHSGDWNRESVEKFKGGWPVKLEQLADALRSDMGTKSTV